MLPIVLDVSHLRLAVVGGGAYARRRLAMLDAAGAAYVRVYAADAAPELAVAAGTRLVPRLPDAAEFADYQLVYIADIAPPEAEALSAAARDAGALVNVEDMRALCDFHVPSMVRRGDLLLTVSTAGQSPSLARRLRQVLAEQYPALWAERLQQIACAREGWRAAGAGVAELSERTNRLIDEKGWL